jgi:anti-sigma regulatory factor (Ser/Thr protein kinase)
MDFELLTPHTLHLRLGMEATSPSRGRKAVRAEIAGWSPGCNTDWLDTLELLTSELITNALLHADTRAIDVTALQARDGVLVTVTDGDSRGPVLLPDEHPGVLGGRGLLLVDALADQWGINRHSTGKTVWFRQDMP